MPYVDSSDLVSENESTASGSKFNPVRISTVRHAVKRVFDVFLASLLLILLSPFYLMVTLLLAFEGGPVHYSQRRLGQYGRIFRCHKFRTMVPDAEKRLAVLLAEDPIARAEWDRFEKLRNDPRITRLGAFLRKSSLDELPQLWNVLKGDMSLVGPRPIALHERSRWGEHFRYYEAMLPGITGVWQIYFRTDSEYRSRIIAARYYCKKWSMLMDFCLLFNTLKVPFVQTGAY